MIEKVFILRNVDNGKYFIGEFCVNNIWTREISEAEYWLDKDVLERYLNDVSEDHPDYDKEKLYEILVEDKVNFEIVEIMRWE